MFKKKNIIDFLYDVIKDESLDIIPFVKIISMEKCVVAENKISFSDSNKNLRVCQIYLNKKYIYACSKHYIKATILHEIGHAICSSRSKVDNELYAHMWALDKANRMGLKVVIKNLLNILKTWENFNWNNLESRKYILASKKFQKKFDIKNI